MRCKLASAAPESDLLAKEQSKNKVLSLCLENGRRLGFNFPVSSQEDVNMMYNKVKKLSEQDQLSIMRREIKFKIFLFLNCRLTTHFQAVQHHCKTYVPKLAGSACCRGCPSREHFSGRYL